MPQLFSYLICWIGVMALIGLALWLVGKINKK